MASTRPRWTVIFISRLKIKLSHRSTRKRLLRFGFVAGNVILLAVIAVVVLSNPHSGTPNQSILSTKDSSQAVNPLDQVSSTDIALTVSRLSGLPETTAISNQADTERILATVASSSTSVASKPQVVSTTFKSNKDIQVYVVRPGESVADIAAKFNVTSDSIRWSNGLSGNVVNAGTRLFIPPVNGIVYTVKSGDTPDSLALKYHSQKNLIIAYNDAEIKGLQPGEQIIIPNGKIIVAPTYYSSYSPFSYDDYGNYAGSCSSIPFVWNGYDACQCTWYVAYMRAKVGSPLPTGLGNANAWLTAAGLYGMATGRQPRSGAVIWFNPPGGSFVRYDVPRGQTPAYLGHVAYVESVDADGTVHASDMNWIPYSRRYFTLSPSEASQFWYIY